MKVVRFEDIKAWQRARELANLAYDAAGIVLHNIAEGFDAGCDSEFTNFLKMARRSATEVKSKTYPALDR